MLNPWAAVRVCSRRGAAHQRRGQPCQDASLQRRFTTGRGEPLVLLVVADGHGSARHHRSEVGSVLACQAAAAALEEALAQGLEPGAANGADPSACEALRHWLAVDWSAALHRHWRAATEVHWRAHPAAEDTPYSPIPYGTTLGLLLLGPRWWAHAGLGDWDLVQISAAGETQLLSEEKAPPGAGEATWSLCQEGGALMGWRWGVEPLAAGAGCTLVLSTDGVRKSCASDGDFLALARWLAELDGEAPEPGSEEPSEAGRDKPSAAGREQISEAGREGDLALALDRISREGCGDDVSVALAQGAAAPACPPAVAMAEAIEEAAAVEPARSLPAEAFQHAVAVAPQEAEAEKLGAGRLAFRRSRGGSQGRPQASLSRPPRSLGCAGAGLALWILGLGGLAFGIAAAVRWVALPRMAQHRVADQRTAEPRAAEPRTAEKRAMEPVDAWRREVERLCRAPELVGPSLASRRSQVEALRRGAVRPEALLEQPHRDPLGALIAAGFPALPAERLRQSGFARLPLCPALRHGLDQIWKLPPSP